MNIVVLDGYTLNPGDLSWAALEEFGKCTVFPRTAESDIEKAAGDAEVVLTNKVPLSAETIARLPALRYIGVLATGYNVVDVRAAAARNIVITNAPAYGTRSVAQHTMALMLELANHVGDHADGVRDGQWSRSADWCYWSRPLIELDGLKLGIIGAGRIGNAVAQLAEAFGMEVTLVTSKDGKAGVRSVLGSSDVVSLHCPLAPDTMHLINRESLESCKPSLLLVNTARGGLINEDDLAHALNNGMIAGAALDVLSVEPPRVGNPLIGARNCILTPHLAWASYAARNRLLKIAVENLRAYRRGMPVNRVN